MYVHVHKIISTAPVNSSYDPLSDKYILGYLGAEPGIIDGPGMAP